MTCEDVQGSLPAWMDGEVGAAEGVDLAAHVGGCTSCKADAAALGRVHAELDALIAPVSPASETAFAGLWQQLEESGDVSAEGRRRLGGRTGSSQGRHAAAARRVPRLLPRGSRWLGLAGTALAAGIALMAFSNSPKETLERRPLERPAKATSVEDGVVDVAQQPADPPAELRQRAGLFLDYPIVRRLDELQTLEAVLAEPHGQEARG